MNNIMQEVGKIMSDYGATILEIIGMLLIIIFL